MVRIRLEILRLMKSKFQEENMKQLYVVTDIPRYPEDNPSYKYVVRATDYKYVADLMDSIRYTVDDIERILNR